MKISKLETGNFKLDGGATFGVIPKSIWNKVYPADEKNMCNLSMRCLLIETDNKKILIDTGIGDKQTEKFFSYYYLNGRESLDTSLNELGISKADITDVILTHLHFDHCGGAVEKDAKGDLQITFPNAEYWISGSQWHWAMTPNQRERASFLMENFEPIERTGKLNFINESGEFCKGLKLELFNGHTEGLIVPFIQYKDETIVYTGDLIPTSAHIPSAWVCGYDTRPLLSMEEREIFKKEALKNKYILFFEHDVNIECCTLKASEKGIIMDRSFELKDLV